MNRDKFYFIKHIGQSKFCYVSQNLSFERYNKQKCVECGRDVSTMLYSCDENQLVIEGGKDYPDLLQFCGAGDKFMILSDKAVKTFKENDILGFFVDCKPLLLKIVRNNVVILNDVPIYYIIKVTGKIDYDFQSMFLKKKKQCRVCGQYDLNRKRLYPQFVDIETWDGSDICSLITFPRRIVCTERIVEIVKKYGLKGFDFEVIETSDTHTGDGSLC